MKIVGHRGARGLAPENTIAGLRKAVRHCVDEIEFDLRVTKDNIVVLDHDGFITDPNGQKLVISDHDFKTLQSHKPDLTTFREVLGSDITTPLYVEIKDGEDTKPIIELIRHSQKQLRVASFNLNILLEIHRALPEIEIIVNEKWSGVRATHRARKLHTKRISMNQKWLWEGFIRPMASHGWQLYAYTLNDPVKAKRWKSYGLAGIITDYPDRFQK
jgi:glycerophosphoryl diester phosphodiesterase